MSEAKLLICFLIFLMELWSDADFVDISKYSITTSAQDGSYRVQAGRQDGRLEGQDESVIIVALESLNDKLCFP